MQGQHAVDAIEYAQHLAVHRLPARLHQFVDQPPGRGLAQASRTPQVIDQGDRCQKGA
jgi:hypothetical protein